MKTEVAFSGRIGFGACLENRSRPVDAKLIATATGDGECDGVKVSRQDAWLGGEDGPAYNRRVRGPGCGRSTTPCSPPWA